MIFSRCISQPLAMVLAVLLLPWHAISFQAARSSSNSEAEGYLFQAADSVRRNRPLEETKSWCEKALKALASKPSSDAANSMTAEVNKICVERESDLKATERSIRHFIDLHKIESAAAEFTKRSPPDERRFLDLRRDIARLKQEAQEQLNTGSNLAESGGCSAREQVLSHYQKAQRINSEIDMTQANDVPKPCPPFSCAGKCKLFIVLGIAAGVGAGTVCYLDSRKGKSCVDRVR